MDLLVSAERGRGQTLATALWLGHILRGILQENAEMHGFGAKLGNLMYTERWVLKAAPNAHVQKKKNKAWPDPKNALIAETKGLSDCPSF